MDEKKHRIEKLQKAIDLASSVESPENITKSIGIFNQLCLASHLKPDDKFDVYLEYVRLVPDEAQDMINRWRDMLQFVKGQELEELVNLLSKISRSTQISSHERMTTAVCLYNNCFLSVCYMCFEDIACDRSALVDYRVDAARYLFGTQDDEYKETAQDALMEIIECTEYPSDYRYKIIAGFISRTGISTKLNALKLKVPYDEQFVYGLQVAFFNNHNNSIRDRILSGQNLLQMTCICDEEKTSIENVLLDISENNDLPEDTRADAADVVLRCGSFENKERTKAIIEKLGYSSVDEKGSLTERVKTIYTNSQNIHEIHESAEKFIESIIKEKAKTRPFHEVHSEISEMLRNTSVEPSRRFQAFKALNRISIDSARFTAYKVTLSEIFVHVWARIMKYTGESRDTLQKRMLDELIEMGDTCSSGHSDRFVNVLAGFDSCIEISFAEQIKSNMVGRMAARIRDCSDVNIAARLAMAESEFGDIEDRQAYNKFIRDNIPSLREELHKEFVGEGHVTSEEFSVVFDGRCEEWMLKIEQSE